MEKKSIETKSCTHCGKSFAISDRDVELLDKLSPIFGGKKYLIPSPTLCPDCRQQRRLVQRNERNLYKRTCDFSGKEIVSMYSPDKPCTVYDQKIWRSEEWNQFASGQEINFQKNFFEQFYTLSLKAPRPSLINMSSENSEYTNHSAYNKDCYMCINTGYSENSMYCTNYCIYDKNCLDCLNIHHSENCYFCTDVKELNDCIYMYNSMNCFKCSFCEDCQGCNNCFLCTNLRNKSFCIENKQYSKEEYGEKVDEYVKSMAQGDIATFTRKYQDIMQNSLHKNVIIEQCERCTGDRMYTSKNTQDSYSVFNMHDCSFCYDAGEMKNCSDAYEPFTGENHYETHACNLGYNLMCCSKCYESTRVYYSQYCRYCKDCFGCLGLRNKQYCIFNKQYTESEYEELVTKLIDYMRTTGEWGEFFPPATSMFGYNETAANEYYPLSKEDAVKHGFNWSEYEAPFPKVDKILKSTELPNTHDVTDDILQQAIECEVSKKPFRVIKQELEFYRKHNLPIPRRHPDIRHADRMGIRNPRKLRDRTCMKCGIDIKTSYSPERKEQVYCEGCYNKEIYG